MRAADLFVQCLKEEAVEYVFGVPGEENADFMISEGTQLYWRTSPTGERIWMNF
jgi:hypothetical protein